MRPATASPQRAARLCGALYLYIVVAAIFAEIFVRGRLIDSADATATARNILDHELLFRIGASGELLHIAFDVVVAVLLYVLLRPVSRGVALLAAFARLACDVVLAIASLTQFAALRLFQSAGAASSFSPDQRAELGLQALNLHGDGYAICLVFFAFACFALGHLIYHSGFLPRTLGVLMTVAGAAYLVDSFSHFVAPAFAATLFPGLFLPMFLAEISLALWLAVKGVNVAVWQEKAGAQARPAEPAAAAGA